MVLILKKWGYFHNERVFCCKVLSFFITHQDLSFGCFALKIELVVFVYELFNYEIIFFNTWLCNYFNYEIFFITWLCNYYYYYDYYYYYYYYGSYQTN